MMALERVRGELLGLTSRLPTAATFTLRRFAARGGLDERLIDGWGIALDDGTDLRAYREPEPARDSPWLAFIEQRRVRTRLLISHIRHATRGAVTLANTQPIAREIGGRIEPPGLWQLRRRCASDADALSEAGITLETHGPAQEIELLASVALSGEENWRPLAEGEVIAV
jgi:predicted glutamine amidotransferase